MDSTTLDFFPSGVLPLIPFFAFVALSGMCGFQSSPDSLQVPIFCCAALAMKRGTVRPDGTIVGVVGFDHKLHIRLHLLCFLLGVIVEV